MAAYLEILLRTVIAYFALMLLTRLTGRREINQLTFPDFTESLAVGAVAANLSFGSHRTIPHLLFSLAVWTALTIGTDLIALHSHRMRALLDGQPTVVVNNGKLLEGRMRALRYSVDDLLSLLREQGIFSISDVEFAVVEPSGRLSARKKSQHRALTPADLAIPTKYEGISVTLIGDGAIRHRNLALVGLTEDWLLSELKERGMRPEEVVLAQLDTSGNLYIDLRQDGV